MGLKLGHIIVAACQHHTHTRVAVRSKFIRVLIAAAAAILTMPVCLAEPYLAVRQGLDCAKCHVNPTGGGLRNPFGNVYGQAQLSTTGAVQRSGALEAWNGQLNSLFSAGGDVRVAATQADVDDADTNLEFATQRATVYLGLQLTDTLSIYLDQQVAPGGSLNREAWLKFTQGDFYLKAGKLFMPFGWRLEDNSALVRQISGINMLQGDDGVEVGWQNQQFNAQLAVTNGSGGGTERDDGKQFTARAAWQSNTITLGLSLVDNNTDVVDRQGYAVFAGLRTGPVSWLAEYNFIEDESDLFGEEENEVAHLEANWLIHRGHNLKITAESARSDLTRDTDYRYGLVYEATPFAFAQIRIGYRDRESDASAPLRNSSEAFVELHGYF